MQSAVADTVVFYREIAGWVSAQLLGIVDFNYAPLSSRIWKWCYSGVASYLVSVHRPFILNLGQQIREVVDVCNRRVGSRIWAYNTRGMCTNSNIWNLVAVNQFIFSKAEHKQAQGYSPNADPSNRICNSRSALYKGQRKTFATKTKKCYKL